jgi:hypothetical protein
MELAKIVADVGDALVEVDRTGIAFKNFQPGIGPYGKPQLVSQVAQYPSGSPTGVGSRLGSIVRLS